MAVTNWLFVLFFLIWIGYDVYTVLADIEVYGVTPAIGPTVARALWALVMLVLYVSITMT